MKFNLVEDLQHHQFHCQYIVLAANLPKLYPAIKRGQEVDVTFELPILVSTE